MHENRSKALYSLDNSYHVIMNFLIAFPEKIPKLPKQGSYYKGTLLFSKRY